MRHHSRVSIHAPTWGATCRHRLHRPWATRFNPRAHVGRDLIIRLITGKKTSFNPRAHVGRDDNAGHIPARDGRFNPRAHVGRDQGHGASTVKARGVSIHAPTWGATLVRCGLSVNSLFQSTRPRGARPQPRESTRPRGCFNPRAHVGRDLYAVHGALRRQGFNPRAHVGRDHTGRPDGPENANVSIHAPTWGATWA